MHFLEVLLLLAICVGCSSQGQSCCDKGWLKLGSNCYFFNHDPKGQANWRDAKQVCQFLGGHLIDIRSETEWHFVKSHLRRSNSLLAQYMIGMTDAASEGQWKDTDGTNVSFFKWKGGEPNGGRYENCGSIFTDTTFGLYNDGPCTYKYGRFICKKRCTA